MYFQKTQIASIVPKKEIKEDMNDNSEGETNSESSDEDEEDEMEESMHVSSTIRSHPFHIGAVSRIRDHSHVWTFILLFW